MIAIIGSPASRGAKNRRYRAGYSYLVGVSAYGLSGFEVRRTKRKDYLHGLKESWVHANQSEDRLRDYAYFIVDQQVGELWAIDQNNSLAN